jgi:hypothetical protein
VKCNAAKDSPKKRLKFKFYYKESSFQAQIADSPPMSKWIATT